ncbi:hypothetical protein [Burkholderia sp. Bp8991]|uniref:hypothetical protein n=1 Tax=Burkholderia sp. Bp8991 TaxID=2184553 RepID=UPI0021AB4223|nr:hypothetical protein [Burkholderia sp. Bp8991]
MLGDPRYFYPENPPDTYGAGFRKELDAHYTGQQAIRAGRPRGAADVRLVVRPAGRRAFRLAVGRSADSARRIRGDMLGFSILPAAMSTQPVDLSHTLPYEKAFFDGHLAIERNDLDISALLGMDDEVPDGLLASLCGAPSGSDVQAYLDSAGRLTFSVTHPTLIQSENRISVFQTGDSQVLELRSIDLVDSAAAGLGAAMLWRIVRACDTLGIARITAFAIGGRKAPPESGGQRLYGYYAWPRFGFDASIPGAHADEAALFQFFRGYPVGLADGSLRSLRMLYTTRIGRDFWRAAGSHRWMTFDVASHGASVLALRDYLIKKGIYDARKA